MTTLAEPLTLATLPTSSIGRLVTGVRAFTKLVRNPADPLHGPVFQMCVEHGFHRALLRVLARTREGRRLLDVRPRLNTTTVSLAAMGALPEGTLGRAYKAYFEDNGLGVFEPPRIRVETSEEFLCARMREAHDVLHVITGYGTDDIGEIELQCFNLANVPGAKIPLVTIAGAIVTSLMGRMAPYGGLFAVIARMRAAYRRGRASRALASIMWEDHWDRPLDELQLLLCAPAESSAS